jgi:hypothetical protein
MSRFPVDEIFWRRTNSSEFVSFGRNYSVLIVAPGTDDPLVLWSEEEGGVEVAQPLLTDVDGRALGKEGEHPWSDAADYDVIVNGQRYPKRVPAGGGGGAVASVAGKTGVVTLEVDDVAGAAVRSHLELNVKDYGAVGDGEADDTAAIAAALDDAGGGGIVKFPHGDYVTETIELGDDQWLVGCGPGGSRLILKDGTDDDLIRTKEFASLTGTNTEAGPQRFGILDMRLDGNNHNNSAGCCLKIYGRYYFLQRVQIENSPEDGLYSEWYAGGDQMEAYVRDCKIADSEGNGVTWKGPHDSNWSDCQVIRAGTGKTGILVQGGAAAGTNFNAVHVWGEGPAVGWDLNSAAAYLINCQGEGASDAQMIVQNDECEVIGGHFFGQGEGDPSTAIRFGWLDEGSFPGNCQIDSRASRAGTVVELSASAGSNRISLVCENSVGNDLLVGTANPSDRVSIISGDPTDLEQAVSLDLSENEAPGTPPDGRVRIFSRDDGEGGVELCVALPSGEVIVLDGGGEGAVASVNGKTGVVTGLEETANKDTDGTLAANSDTKYASQKATKTYVDSLLAASDAVIYKGAKDCSANPKYPAASAGHLYRVSVAGKIGGASGTNVEVGDTLLCNTDSTAEGTQAEVGSKWNVIQANVDGAVIGPASSTSANLSTFSGTTGKIVQDSGVAISTDGTMASNSDAKTPTEKATKTYADEKVPKSLVDAKGDLLVGTADNAVARKAAGSNGKVLSSASGESDGLKWLDNNRIESHTFAMTPTAATLGGFFIRIATGETVKLIGVRHKTASGTWKFKLKRTTSGGSSSEPTKEQEGKSEAQEKSLEVELADKDLLELIGESVSSVGLTYVTVFIERTR